MKRIRKIAAYYLFLHDDNDILVKLSGKQKYVQREQSTY